MRSIIASPFGQCEFFLHVRGSAVLGNRVRASSDRAIYTEPSQSRGAGEPAAVKRSLYILHSSERVPTWTNGF